jgi:4'-phosphopantetheinyl transferase
MRAIGPGALDTRGRGTKHRPMDLPLPDLAPGSAVPALAPDEIHLWQLRGGERLTPRGVSATAHRHLGRLLSAYAGTEQPLAIVRGAHGKPAAPDAGGIEFNLSHSGRHVLIAFARGQALGVDVEAVDGRHRSVMAIAQRFFAPEEAAALEPLDEAGRRLAFLRLWTCKEAVLKALGSGLHFGLDRLRFSLDAAGLPQAVRAVGAEPLSGDWRLQRWEAPGETVAALAWQGPPRRLRIGTIDVDG